MKIKIFDRVVRTLGSVIYVPKMRRNLISLGRLDSKECKYLATGGAMKITRDCLVQMKGNRRQDGLYYLSGSTLRSSIPLISMDSQKQSTWKNQH